MFQGWYPSPKTKFICVEYTPYTNSLKEILYNVLKIFVHEMEFYGVEFTTCGVISNAQIVLDFGHLGFWIRHAQRV